MRYVYGCSRDKSHPRQEVEHGMTEVLSLVCQECNQPMSRVPQRFQFGINPVRAYFDRMETNYHNNHARRRLSK